MKSKPLPDKKAPSHFIPFYGTIYVVDYDLPPRTIKCSPDMYKAIQDAVEKKTMPTGILPIAPV